MTATQVPASQIAKSITSPRLPQLPNIWSQHTPDDSLRVLNHLQLSQDDARYVRAIGLLPIATEYSLKKRRVELCGGVEGKTWVSCKTYSLRRRFRTGGGH